MELHPLTDLLSRNRYPGRGVLLGAAPDGAAVAAYFIMGRSVNSRNRVFVPTEDGIRTQAHDPALMTDPTLVIYHPVRAVDGALIVTNGDQTDTIRDALRSGGTFASALDTRTYEPDAPHYTPRVSGILEPDGAFRLSILKRGGGGACCRYLFSYDRAVPGEGRLLHTYRGDGDPLPSFQGEPVRARLDAPDPDALAEELWNALDRENRVALFVRYRGPAGGAYRDVIRNQLD